MPPRRRAAAVSSRSADVCDLVSSDSADSDEEFVQPRIINKRPVGEQAGVLDDFLDSNLISSFDNKKKATRKSKKSIPTPAAASAVPGSSAPSSSSIPPQPQPRSFSRPDPASIFANLAALHSSAGLIRPVDRSQSSTNSFDSLKRKEFSIESESNATQESKRLRAATSNQRPAAEEKSSVFDEFKESKYYEKLGKSADSDSDPDFASDLAAEDSEEEIEREVQRRLEKETANKPIQKPILPIIKPLVSAPQPLAADHHDSNGDDSDDLNSPISTVLKLFFSIPRSNSNGPVKKSVKVLFDQAFESIHGGLADLPELRGRKFQFYFDGNRIAMQQTPKILELEPEDMIEVKFI